MLFSSKITNSVITFLEKQSVSIEPLYEDTSLPLEFLRDSSYWVPSDEMETFLVKAEKIYEAQGGEDLIRQCGHSCAELHAWGVLDSVLRMMESAPQIYSQPERFLSYFISPPPPISISKSNPGEVCFQIPLASDQFPKTLDYLTAATEGLPKFFSQELAQVKWTDVDVQITWSEGQESLFGESDNDRRMSPQFMQEIVSSMEQNQRELEEKNKELLLKNKELEKAQEELKKSFHQKIYSEKLTGLSELALGVAHEISSPISYVASNARRMQDYFTRSQQLVALLVGQGRKDKQVEMAMKRTDWSYVIEEFPKAVQDSLDGLEKIQHIVKDLSFLAGPIDVQKEQRSEADLNEIVKSALQTVRTQFPESIRLDHHFLLERPISIDPSRMEQALVSFLNSAAKSIDGEGAVRVVTRPRGEMAQIEISDTGKGMDSETLDQIFTPFYTTKQPGKGTGLGLSIAHSIVKMHHGSVKVDSKLGQGSTFLIELPN